MSPTSISSPQFAVVLFRMGQRPLDLAGLHLRPGLEPVLLGPVANLVDLKKRGIHDAVCEGLARQRVEASEAEGYDPTTSRQHVQKLENDPAVVKAAAVVEHEAWDLSQRVLARRSSLGSVVSATTTSSRSKRRR